MGHLNSNLLWHKYAEEYFLPGTSIVEIGPAGYPTYYEKKLRAKNIDLDYKVLDVSTDYISGAEANPNFILSCDPMHYAVEDDAFDIVFSDQVMAHVGLFWIWYQELIRITKPGGYIITICSKSYAQCPSPIDAWRIHSDGMQSLNDHYKLQTIHCSTESAEMEHFKVPKKTGYYYAGSSFIKPHGEDHNKVFTLNMLKNRWNKMIGSLPGIRAALLSPVQVAFDTISIAQKPNKG